MNKIRQKNKLFSFWTFGLFAIGVAINVFGAKLMVLFEFPIFFDTLGTMLAAAIGGLLPGIATGFVSNLFTSFSDPISRYYAILSIFIAVVITILSYKGFLRKWWGYVIAFFASVLIGGALGSVFTWFLYGGGIGTGISSPFANQLFLLGWQPFLAQFVADIAIDLIDKSITVVLLAIILFFFPQGLCDKFLLGNIYSKNNQAVSTLLSKNKSRQKHFSIKTRITLLIVVASILLSVIGTGIGISIYIDNAEKQYASICEGAVNVMLKKIDPEKVELYLDGEENVSYIETEQSLYEIYDGLGNITYMYVYQIQPDGQNIFVVFDLDNEELKVEGEQCGAVLPFDPTFEKYKNALVNGEEIPTVISNDKYGWLISVYKPIVAADGHTVAYAAADIEMSELVQDIYEYAIRILSMLFGVSIIIIVFCLWYADFSIVAPVNSLVNRTRTFALYKDSCKKSDISEIALPVQTGDELEELYSAICSSEKELIEYINEIKEKSAIILKMQRNVVYAFANMVESRDKNTGDHIKRTSYYVKLITASLMTEEKYSDILSQEYVLRLVQSAPLHDIGKISISDTILNKPGKLTEEEFSIMKTHTLIGHQILELSLKGIEDGGYLEVAKDIAHYHHERWDGTGYPDGLKGQEIPLAARIMAVADVFDALVSARSYKPPFEISKAVEIINNESGTHFDPIVVDAFNACLPTIKSSISNNIVDDIQ